MPLLALACVGRQSSLAADDGLDATDEDSKGGDSSGKMGRPCTGQAGEQPGVNCIPPQPDGGIYGQCRLEGEEIEGKVVGAYCCEGLKKIPHEILGDGGCKQTAPDSVLWCARCGDGECNGIENRCNCPGDCADE